MGSHGSDAAEEVLIALRRIVRQLRLAERDARPRALSAAQLFVLHVLIEAPAHSLAEVARRTLTDQSSVSTVVAKLVERKLVSRTPSTSDRRRVTLALTAAGAAIAAKSGRLPQLALVDAVRGMPATQQQTLVAALAGLVRAMGADEVAAGMLLEDEP